VECGRNDGDRENLIAWGKSIACVNLPTTNPTCAGLRLYPDAHCGRLVTDDSNHGMAAAEVDSFM
jgi:hypothetical protein